MIRSEYLENELARFETDADDYNFFAISYFGKKYKMNQLDFSNIVIENKDKYQKSTLIPKLTNTTILYFDLDNMTHDINEFIENTNIELNKIFDKPDLSNYITKNIELENYHVYYYNIVNTNKTYKYVCKTINDIYKEEVIDLNLPDKKIYLRVDGFEAILYEKEKFKYEGYNCELDKEFYLNTYPNKSVSELTKLKKDLINVTTVPKLNYILNPSEIEFDLSDMTCAKYFEKLYGNDWVYEKSDQLFYNYNVKYWTCDRGDYLIFKTIGLNLMKDMRAILFELIKKNEEKYSAMMKSILQLKSATKIKNIIKCIKAILIKKVSFDTNPYIVVFDNGIYDIKENKFRLSRREEYISNYLSTGYNYRPPNKDNIRFLKTEYLPKIFTNKEERDTYLIYTSTMLVGHYIKYFRLNKGVGNNAKSQITNFNASVMGEYASKMNNDLILSFTPDRASMFKLNKKRYVYFEEPDKDKIIQASRLKDWTGGNSIDARRLYSEESKIDICLTIDINFNIELTMNPVDNAIKNRLIEQTFSTRFVNEADVDEANKKFLGNKSFERKDWFDTYKVDYFHILLDYLKKFLDNNLVIDLPEQMKISRDQYLLNSDNFLNWFYENYEVSEVETDIIRMNDILENFTSSGYFRSLQKTKQRKGKALLIRELEERDLLKKYFDRKQINKKLYRSIFTHLKYRNDDIEEEIVDYEEI